MGEMYTCVFTHIVTDPNWLLVLSARALSSFFSATVSFPFLQSHWS